MTMCVASCSNYEQGWFTAYRRLAEEQPDLVVHLGDYQYEYAASGKGVRQHVGPETVTLANYRQRYAQYKTDPDLQAAHAAAPWLAVLDDHEVADNWADEVPAKPDPAFLESTCRGNAGVLREHAVAAICRAAWHRHAALPANAVGQPGDAAHARHPAIPNRSAVRRRVPHRLHRTGTPACDADGRRAGTLAAQRVSAIPVAMGHPRSAGVLLPGRVHAGAGSRIQLRRMGRLRGQPRSHRRWPGALTRPQCCGAHRRRPCALGGRGALAIRRSRVAYRGDRAGDDVDQFGRRRVRYA